MVSNARDNIDESNTTANLFLGGVRRDWMGSAEKNSSNRSRDSSRVEMPAPANSNPEATPLSPVTSVTPCETLQPSASIARAKNPDTPETALPSPALSTTSRPSPVSVDFIASTSRLPPDSTSTATQIQENNDRMAVQPPKAPVAEHIPSSLAVAQSQTDLPSRPPPEYPSSDSRPPPQRQNEAAPSPVAPVVPGVSEETWNGWSLQLKSMQEEWTQTGFLQASEGERNVVRPRINLLEQAVDHKDLFYLVIHQLYCQCTIDPLTLERIRAPARGMDMLFHLLEDNRKMNPSVTFRFAHFPYSPQQLSQQEWYLRTLQTVPLFLMRVANEMAKFYNQATHAPLVSTLSELFGHPSPVLLSVIFTFVSNRLHETEYIKPLQRLLWKDWASFMQCQTSNKPDTETATQSRNRNLIQTYLSFPRKSSAPSEPGSFPDHENIRPVETISPVQGILSTSSSSPFASGAQTAISPPIRSPSVHSASNPVAGRSSEPFSGQAPSQPQYSGRDMPMPTSPGYYSQIQQGQTLVYNQGQRGNNQIPQPVQMQVQRSQIQSPQGQRSQIQRPHVQTSQTHSFQRQSPQVQNPQAQTPQFQNSQMRNPQTQNLHIQWQRQMKMPMQAVRHGQVAPATAYQNVQIQNSQGQGAANRSRSHGPVNSANAANSSNSPTLPSQLVTFTSSLPQTPNPLSMIPTPTSANYVLQLPNGQLVPQYPHIRRNHQLPPNSLTASPATHLSHLAHQVQAYHQSAPHRQPMTTPFFAAAGYKAPITVNGDPLRIGLHLVHPRDPMKRLVEIGPNGEPIETDLFSYFNAFIVPPTLIDPKEPDYTWNFKLAQVDLQRFPRVSKANGGHTSVWTYQPGSCNLRLRCIRLGGKPVPVEGNLKSVQNNLGSADGTSDSVGGKYGSGKGKRGSVEEIKWAVSPTYWPSVFYITVNGKELQVRRKVHNGKDLPLDITQHLKAGDNSIRIDLLLGKDECKDNQYHFGVEIMEVTAFEDILHLVQPIPAADARASIQKRLTPIANDDDLAVVTDSLTINLVDPFMARIFDVPVRSKNCTHAECFDRDTFIRTRKSASGRAPMVDSWRCPVCKADARPKSLVVDYFLAEIHAELARTNRLDGAQAVQVNADGTWVLRTNTDDTSPAPQGGSHSGPTSQKRKSVSDDALEPAATRPRLDYKPDVSQPLVSRHYHDVIELD